MKRTVFALAVSTMLSGCFSMFTDIRANGDGSYMLTYTKQFAFRSNGEVYRCTPTTPQRFDCVKIDSL